jgi:uncharacterized membrane protein
VEQQLASLLEGLSAGHQAALRQALANVDQATVHGWSETGTLREWVTQGARVMTGRADGERLLTTLLAATAQTLPALASREIGEWMRVGCDIASADPLVFSRLPDGFAENVGEERLSFYRVVRSAAYYSPSTAAALYRALPRGLQLLAGTARIPLLRCVQAAATFDPEPLPIALQLFIPTLRSLPEATQTSLLERIAQFSLTFPAGVARLFRSLARAYEEVGEEGVKTWIAAGEAIAEKNPQAGEAFFSLESRTSLLLLRGASPAVHLQDVQGVLLKYLHMMCGDALGIAGTPYLSFPPPLAEMDSEALPLPATVESFSTYEDNFRLYRVLAAQQAGRIAFGTYDYSVAHFWSLLPPMVKQLAEQDATPPEDFAAYFKLFPQPDQLEALFLFIESRRIAAHLSAMYRGLRGDLEWVAAQTELLPVTLTDVLPRLPQSVWRELGNEATVIDALSLATELHMELVAPHLQRIVDARAARQARNIEQAEPELGMAAVGGDEDTAASGSALSPDQQEMMQKILKAIRKHGQPRKRKARQEHATAILRMDDEIDDEELEDDVFQPRKKRGQRRQTATGLSYFYDEWDFLIEDYRSQWCQVREFPVMSDQGAFFSRTLATYPDITEEIKREFRRLRPRLYRQVKGLEDGEHIDLDAAISARVDIKSGVAPSPKLYIARQPLERDVAALFLLDLSASTDSQLTEREGVRVIDIMKESVVLLSAALDTIGDSYAVYGFSSQGRRNVELYPVKSFVEPLSTDVKGRIGGLEPQKSTRMGAAVRHAARKLRDLACRAKFLILLSDGHPEDADYGPNAHTPTYGLRDTMMALREAEHHGILSFCLTVDKAGKDYLREMCAPSRYMIIEDPSSLPLELPKIYQRHIRMQKE